MYSSKIKYTSNQKKENYIINNKNSNIQFNQEKNYSKNINNKYINRNISELSKENYSFDKKNKNNSNIKIEYEKINKTNEIINEENDNFNVYFMKPNIKSKTLSTTKIIDENNENGYEDDDEDYNPYKESNINNEPQFQDMIKRNALEIVYEQKEKKFKAHLVQKLIAYKRKQDENRKIPLNLKSKIKRDESFRDSLKHLLMKQSEKKDMKKELIYYKGYFRFWKKKAKEIDEQRYRKRMNLKIKKDRNIRITTVIYNAEISKRIKKIKKKVIEEKKIQYEKNEKFKQNLINNLQKRKTNILKNYNNQNINNKENNLYNINSPKIYEEQKISEIVKIIPKKEKNEKLMENIEKENKNIIKNKNISKNSINENIDKKKEEKKGANEIKRNENMNKKKEAIRKINKIIEKENEREGFETLKKHRSNSRKKEGTEKLNKIIGKKYSKSIITGLKKNQNESKISQAFNIINNLIKKKKKKKKKK